MNHKSIHMTHSCAKPLVGLAFLDLWHVDKARSIDSFPPCWFLKKAVTFAANKNKFAWPMRAVAAKIKLLYRELLHNLCLPSRSAELLSTIALTLGKISEQV